ncbi:GHMP family kinase ATP-binding protein [Gottfriedia solisilvae]|uniref:GHMP kinase N-terminal domain-containing protein n=1 Tax=Gottfriedia solisilvae TaxID=1516104 RepID=A0A8J3F210_9BACI|nr:hypothetical protein [Gottfriedia solisilvae]GGI17509.1 hypothetical protein GCM10007380_38300 [Gottfriedia solisilvae]
MDVNELALVYKRYYDSDYRIFFVSGHDEKLIEIVNAKEYNGNQNFGTYVLIAKNKKNKIRLVSLNYEELGIIEFSLTELAGEKLHDWTNYLKSTIRYLKEAGYQINHGMDLLICGNIPNEVGLSSSTSIEALTAVIIKSLYR